jgi:DNA-binding transcriptional regulator YiaG
VNGSEVRRIRKQLGLTQDEFARLIGVHLVSVSRWETGKMGIRLTAEKLMRLLAKSAVKSKKGRR